MQLSILEVERFFRIHRSRMLFGNQRLKLLPNQVATPENDAKLAPEQRYEIHKAFVKHRELIDAFVAENPFRLNERDLEVVRSWKHLVTGPLSVFRYLKRATVFLSTTQPAAYGVLALFDPFQTMIGPNLPRRVNTTLLPFEGKIVSDGLLSGDNATFGGVVRRRLNESCNATKARSGIITALPAPAEPAPAAKRKPAPRKKTVPSGAKSSLAAAHAAHEQIVNAIDAFCYAHLDEQYAALSRKLAGVLARKRPTPLTRGKPESWASGIVCVVGRVHFLDDPSQPLHLRLSDIDSKLGVSEATGAAKSMAIRQLLKIHRLDPESTVPSKLDQNPLVWRLQVNRLITDIRHAPREIQKQAYRQGRIPSIPADRAKRPEDAS